MYCMALGTFLKEITTSLVHCSAQLETSTSKCRTALFVAYRLNVVRFFLSRNRERAAQNSRVFVIAVVKLIMSAALTVEEATKARETSNKEVREEFCHVMSWVVCSCILLQGDMQ